MRKSAKNPISGRNKLINKGLVFVGLLLDYGVHRINYISIPTQLHAQYNYQSADTHMGPGDENFGSIERLDQGHLYPNLEVPGLTCPSRGSNPGLPRGKRAL